MLHAHGRSFLEPRDVSAVNADLQAHDRNDFLVSNLLADGPIQAYFGRHYWPANAGDNPQVAHFDALAILERSGRDDFHALIFKRPESRMIDKSLWPIAAPRQQWSVTGWPFVWRAKSERMIREYDRRVIANLDEVGGQVEVSSPEVDLYVVTRAAAEARARGWVPEGTTVDLASYNAIRHLRLGWGDTRWLRDEMVGTRDIVGYFACPKRGDPICRTLLTKTGVIHRGDELRHHHERHLRYVSLRKLRAGSGVQQQAMCSGL